jgi:MraZ protein
LYFSGTFDYAIDERGRVPLPPVYRDSFREGVVLNEGHPDRCLRVYTRSAYDEQASEFIADSWMAQRGRDLRRVYFATARHLELDKQNRLLIPPPLRQYAGLDRQVLIIGSGEYLEMWDPARWLEEFGRIRESVAHTFEATAERRRP